MFTEYEVIILDQWKKAILLHFGFSAKFLFTSDLKHIDKNTYQY